MRISLRLVTLSAGVVILNWAGWSQASQTPNGEWQGTLKSSDGKTQVSIVVDLTKSPKGDWIGTFGMPDVGITGLPVANLAVGESTVSFTVPGLPPPGKFEGKISPDGVLSGAFSSGGKMALSLKRTGQAKVSLPTANSTLSKNFEGAWWGSYDGGGPNRYHLILKLSRKPDGTASGTLTNIDGGNIETPLTSVEQAGDFLTFEIRSLNGTFRGAMKSGSIVGEWKQASFKGPLTFARGASVNSVNSPLPKTFEGGWEGTLDGGPDQKVEFVLKLARAADGTATGTLATKEGNQKGLPLSVILVNGNNIQFEIGLIKGKFRGTLNAIGNALAGTWEQEELLTTSLTFKRGVTAAKK